MNRQAVYHSIKSNYSFPVSDNELVIRLRVAKGDAQKVELIHSMKYDWKNGVTEDYDFSLGYFNFFQCPYINPGDVHRKVSWVSGAIVYQIFVERFFVGR